MGPFTWAFAFLIPIAGLGYLRTHIECSQWSGSCTKCSKTLSWTRGIFCANFWSKRGGSHICQSAWCSACYSLPNDQMFHIKTLNDDFLTKDQEHSEEAARLEESWSPKYRNKLDFLEGRPGDHLLVPFECDTCIFLKLRGSLPQENNTIDELLLKCIRRINLDAFWSRSRTTVNSNAISARMQLKFSASVGLKAPFVHTQALPLFDHCGYKVAIGLILYSTRSGRNDPSYTEFDTIRGLRTVYSNCIRAYLQSTSITLALGDFKGNYHRLVTDQCGSFWFKRFMTGLKN